MPPTNRDRFRERQWALISGGLLVNHPDWIHISNFDDQMLLRRDTQNGAWLYSWLVCIN